MKLEWNIPRVFVLTGAKHTLDGGTPGAENNSSSS